MYPFPLISSEVQTSKTELLTYTCFNHHPSLGCTHAINKRTFNFNNMVKSVGDNY